MVTLYSRSTAVTPLASQVQVVGALAANMAFANVVVKLLSRRQTLAARLPLAGKLVAG